MILTLIKIGQFQDFW